MMTSCLWKSETSDTEIPRSSLPGTPISEVWIDTLKKQDFRQEIQSNGNLIAGRKVKMAFPMEGFLLWRGKSNGDYVKEGECIAILDTSHWFLEKQRVAIELEKSELALRDILLGYGYVMDSGSEIPSSMLRIAKIRSGYADAENALKRISRNLKDCYMIAPFAGRIADMTGNLYEKISGDICSLVDDSFMEVEFPVLETELSLVRKGQMVEICPYFNKDIRAEGYISEINPVVNASGQIKVKARVPNIGNLMDGMKVEVKVVHFLSGCWVVPKSAVVNRDGKSVLFCYENGKAKWKYVKILHENSKEYAIVADEGRGAVLYDGDFVIISGGENLSDGVDVDIVARKAA